MSDRHHRLAYTGIIFGVLVVVGLIALNFPVFIDHFDQYGFQIKCGTGYLTDLSQAAAATGGHDYVDQCKTALLVRRLWTIPLVAISALIVLAVTIASAITSGRESLMPHSDTA